MKYIQLAWNWLVFSSNDPEKVSLTIKGILIGALTYATIFANFAHIQLPNDLLTQLVDAVIAVVQNLLLLVTSVAALIGFARKVFMTFAGTNKVLQ